MTRRKIATNKRVIKTLTLLIITIAIICLYVVADASFYAVERRSGKGIKEMIFMERDCKSLTPMY